jgi:regulatory protein
MRRRPAKPPRPLSPASLEATGLWYVERYGGTSKAVRRALWRKVDRVGQHHPTDRGQAAQWIDEIISRFQRDRLIDDDAWARSKANSLFGKGKPPHVIRRELGAKGIDQALAARVVEALVDRCEVDPTILAAARYARRRRLGPYRPDQQRAERRDRDLAAMGRAGFGWAIATQIIDAPDVQSLEALVEP